MNVPRFAKENECAAKINVKMRNNIYSEHEETSSLAENAEATMDAKCAM